MKKFEDWLREEPRLSSLLVMLLPICILVIGVANGGRIIAILCFSEEAISANGKAVYAILSTRSVAQTAFLIMFLWPLIEEVKYRLLPFLALTLLMKVVGVENNSIRMNLIYFYALCSSIVFGYMHGSVGNILIQGLSGLIFVIIFLKWSNLNWKRSIWKGWIASVVVHGSTNGFLAIMYHL